VVRLVLFDGFGTLFDSRGLWRLASTVVLRSVGLNSTDIVDRLMVIWNEEWNRIVFDSSGGKFKTGFEVTVESIVSSLSRIGVVDSYDAEKLARRAIQIYKEGARLAEGAEETLEWLRRREIKTGLVTDADLDLARTVIDKFRIREKMDIILISDVIKAWKPNPKALRIAMKQFKIEPGETLMVGDSVFDILAAKAAGSVSVWIRGELPLPNVKPDFTIQKIPELKEIVKTCLSS